MTVLSKPAVNAYLNTEHMRRVQHAFNTEHIIDERWWLNETNAFTLTQIARNGLQLSKSGLEFADSQMTDECRREGNDDTIQALQALWASRVTLWVNRRNDYGTCFKRHIATRGRHQQLMRRFRAIARLIPVVCRELQDASHRAYKPGGIGYISCMRNAQRLQQQQAAGLDVSAS